MEQVKNLSSYKNTVESFKMVLDMPKKVTIIAGFRTDSEKLHIWSEFSENIFNQSNTGGVYTNPSGIVRDPSIIKFNGKYYVAYTTAFTGTTFKVIESTDLVNWVQTATVNCSSVASLYSTWAPELFIEGNTIYAFVSLSVDGGTTKQIYEVHSTDMTTWSNPQLITITGKNNVIDAFMVKKDDTYFLWYKNETTKYIEYSSSDTITGIFTPVAEGDWAGWGANNEGVSILFKNNKWYAYFDNYAGEKYYSSQSDNWDTWSDKLEVKSNTGIRHGTSLLISIEDVVSSLFKTAGVTLDTTQTISGIKTFSESPIINFNKGIFLKASNANLNFIGTVTGNDDIYFDSRNNASFVFRQYFSSAWNVVVKILAGGKVLLPYIPVYADNASAISGGLAIGTVYKTETGELRIVV